MNEKLLYQRFGHGNKVSNTLYEGRVAEGAMALYDHEIVDRFLRPEQRVISTEERRLNVWDMNTDQATGGILSAFLAPVNEGNLSGLVATIADLHWLMSLTPESSLWTWATEEVNLFILTDPHGVSWIISLEWRAYHGSMYWSVRGSPVSNSHTRWWIPGQIMPPRILIPA